MISVLIACILADVCLGFLMLINLIFFLIHLPLELILGLNVIYIASMIEGINQLDFTG